MHDVAGRERVLAHVAVQEVPPAPGRDRAGGAGIGAALDEDRHRREGRVALRATGRAERGGLSEGLVRHDGGAADELDLRGRLDEAKFGNERSEVNEARARQRRLQLRVTPRRH